jgi:mannan endo-1,4-beta-mannosidase
MRHGLSVLLTSVAIITAGAACTSAPEPAPGSVVKGFVGRCGTQFCVDGKTFYFAGSNTYDMFTFGTWSDDIDARSIDTERIDGHFARLQRDGVSVLRLWMFSHEAWHGFEPAKGVFNESQFVLFDYIIASAGRHGIRLLPVLENYWTAYGGIDARLRACPTVTSTAAPSSTRPGAPDAPRSTRRTCNTRSPGSTPIPGLPTAMTPSSSAGT